MFSLGQVESEKSSSFIKPGESVPVALDKIEMTEEGHLDITFKGTLTSNAGTFKPRFWVSDLDKTAERYNEDKAETAEKHIKQIVEAFFDNETVNKVSGNSVPEYYANIAALLNGAIGTEATMKIVYKYNSDTLIVLPKYGSFISTDFRPRGLKLRPAKDSNGLPYERVEPLAKYG